MTTSTWFEDAPVVGKWSPAAAAAKLRELGDPEAAAALEASARGEPAAGPQESARSPTFGVLTDWLPWRERLWQHTAHTFGYLASAPPGRALLPIEHAGNIAPDVSLRNGRIRITLDRLRVAQYPGGGTHHILFDFYAQNQVAGDVEHLHFNASYRVREGEQAALIGYPVFVGLNVGGEGVAFKCFTVNVKNDQDEALLGFLDSDVFKVGLRLATTVQPALAPLSQMAFSLTKALAVRHQNVPVQDFFMGLDFSPIPTRARLAEGAYLAVQVPESLQAVWDWTAWGYNPTTGQVVNKADPGQLLPYNYLVFSVSRYEGK